MRRRVVGRGGRRRRLVVVTLGVVRQHAVVVPASGGQALGARAQDAHATHDERRHDGDGDADGDRPRDQADRHRVERRRRRRQLRLLVDGLRRRRVEVHPQRYTHSIHRLGLYAAKNIRISADILFRVFHILAELVPYTFVSVNRRNNEARASYTDIFTVYNLYVCGISGGSGTSSLGYAIKNGY